VPSPTIACEAAPRRRGADPGSPACPPAWVAGTAGGLETRPGIGIEHDREGIELPVVSWLLRDRLVFLPEVVQTSVQAIGLRVVGPRLNAYDFAAELEAATP
jgi:hypothetical protein